MSVGWCRSCRTERTWKSRWLSGWRKVTYPISSTRRTAGLWDPFSAWCRVFVASAALKRFTSAGNVVNSTRCPRWHWA
jgi:hypothetical protein